LLLEHAVLLIHLHHLLLLCLFLICNICHRKHDFLISPCSTLAVVAADVGYLVVSTLQCQAVLGLGEDAPNLWPVALSGTAGDM
jgi:hypothetical protein